MIVSLSAQLAEFCTTVASGDIPTEVRARARELALDFLAVVARASLAPSSAMIRNAARALSTQGPCAVIGAGYTLAPQAAALANGGTAHAIEMDDVTELSSLHPGVVVFPAALAMAQATEASGAAFLTSAILGYEVIGRLGNAINVKSHYAQGFHPTATCGTFAAAAIAARLLRLSAERATHALAIAGSMAAGSMQYMDNGSLVKRMHPGMAAHAGIVAALMAAEGITGPREIFEGAHGFLHAYSDTTHPERILAGLGAVWEVSETAIKPHSCCRHNHAAIDALLDVVNAHDLVADQIAAIRVEIPASSIPIVAEPHAIKHDPRSVVDAQFSLPYALAVAARFRRALLPEYREEAIFDPGVRRLLGVVECRPAADLDAVFPATWPARVAVELHDGRCFAAAAANAKGSPRNPLGAAELRAKVHGLLDGIVSSAAAASLIDAAERIDDLPRVDALVAPLLGRPAVPA